MQTKKSLKESVVMAMDGCDVALYPFLPYIFQDHWELGADPKPVITLLRRHVLNPSCLKILDLGCGKGALSIKIAKKFKCQCTGIDAVKEFIEEAKKKARTHCVEKLCRFESGDIRKKIQIKRGFNAILLGSIGPVLGNYFKTLQAVKRCIVDNGLVLIDDGYIKDNNSYTHPAVYKRQTVLKQISAAKMQLIDEIVIRKRSVRESNNKIFKNLKTRCEELAKTHPSQKSLFYDYIGQQENENIVLEKKIICTTMLLKKQK